uniref:Putative aldo/keto reductase n=1 Tax=Linum usitatissimum TaxID=4006 RepID=A0A172MLL0_LINUS|nr:putative aldo/keto reductase [Linum usitatissimum]
MEECRSIGLTKNIGVSNFTCKKLTDLLATAKIPPAIRPRFHLKKGFVVKHPTSPAGKSLQLQQLGVARNLKSNELTDEIPSRLCRRFAVILGSEQKRRCRGRKGRFVYGDDKRVER